MELGIYFKSHHKAGSSTYYDGRQRGTVAVWHDSQLWLYEQPHKLSRKEFKQAIRSAFCRDGERVTGKWPEYSIE